MSNRDEKEPGRILALDLGTKTIGVAISDPGRRFGSSLGTIRRKGTERDLDRLEQIVREKDVKRVVIGLPLHLSGAESEGSRRSRDFGAALEQRLGIRPDYIDEALTTADAEKILVEADLSRKKRKKVIDGLAATFILRAFLAELEELGGKGPCLLDGEKKV